MKSIHFILFLYVFEQVMEWLNHRSQQTLVRSMTVDSFPNENYLTLRLIEDFELYRSQNSGEDDVFAQIAFPVASTIVENEPVTEAKPAKPATIISTVGVFRRIASKFSFPFD